MEPIESIREKLAEPKGSAAFKTGTKIRQLSRSDILRPSAVLKKRLAPAAGRHCSPPPAAVKSLGIIPTTNSAGQWPPQ